MSDELAPWFQKLSRVGRLSEEDKRALSEIVRDVADVPADADLKMQGERPEVVHLVLDGLACRYKVLEDGRRQIVGFMVPGDTCDTHVSLLRCMDHSIATLCSGRIATLRGNELARITAERPALAQLLWISALVDQAILREWLVNVGRRDAFERVSHLLWELFLRYATVGRINGDTFSLPLTQQELADALGLSAVHVNRTIQRLKNEGLIEIAGGRLTILRPAELQAISGFNPDYLHIDEGQRERLGLPAPDRVRAYG